MRDIQAYQNRKKGRPADDKFTKKIQSRFLTCSNLKLQKAKFCNIFAVLSVNKITNKDTKRKLQAELDLKKSKTERLIILKIF